jgi:hypothetical protein
MAGEQQNPVGWIVSNVKDAVGAGAQEVKEASKASLDASRAVMEVYREAAALLRDRGDGAFRTGMAVMEAGFDANFDQLNRLADTKNLQDVMRLQMMWGANMTLAISRALRKANGSAAIGGAKPPEAANA